MKKNDYYDNQENRICQKTGKKYIDIYSSERKKETRSFRISLSRILFCIFFVCIGLIGSMMIYAYMTLRSFNYETDFITQEDNINIQDNLNTEDLNSSNLINDNMILNVLLIGSDSMSVGDGGRSDSILILSVNMRTKKIKITSIMRDTWVSIPGHSKDRINASYAYGGCKSVIDTIHRNFGIYIDRYACVDFAGFSEIIDSIGGIDMYLTEQECSYINKYSENKNNVLKISSGVKHLTGTQALQHARNRNSIGSDYDRTTRQRQVIKSVIEKMKSANITEITNLVSKLAPIVTTNFKQSEIGRLVLKALEYLKYNIEEFRIPTDDNVRNEIYSQKMVLVINNMSKVIEDLKKFIYEY